MATQKFNDEDWFSNYIPYWLEHLSHLKSRETHALEIGSYEGRSACWMLDNLLTHPKSTLVCVDTWDGKDATLGEKTAKALYTFLENIKEYGGEKVITHAAASLRVLAKYHHFCTAPCFDLIYLDGSHEGIDALTDLCLCWPLLKVGGWLIFDDYDRDDLRGLGYSQVGPGMLLPVCNRQG